MSLGTYWNDDVLPSWAMLEDELAQLYEDGIFVAVAAGNSFAAFNEAGLSYPAVSPYVVPVASISADGVLSSFSQRSDRVIAAPGYQITSTVPDHAFGRDGVADDYAAASGTSMASPYVAGASVLVRQAMDLVGYQDISQDVIYDHLRSTADRFYDPATDAYYYQINVQAAIDALMPEDDFGSTLAEAHDLGAVSGTQQLTGLIGNLADRDFFTLTAARTGTLTVTIDGSHELAAEVQVNGAPAPLSGGAFVVEVTQGQTVWFSIATSAGLGTYDLRIELDGGLENLGTIDFARFSGQQVTGETWYQVTAARDGIMTAVADTARAGGDVRLQWTDASGRPLDSVAAAGAGVRADAAVSAGQTVLLRISGNHSDFDFTIANLVQVDESNVEVFGSSGSDVFQAVAGSQWQLSINGIAYQFDGAAVQNVQLHGGASDSLMLQGTAANESAHIRAGSLVWKSGGSQLTAEGITRVEITGGGGYDTAVMSGSSGDDQFLGRPDYSIHRGDAFEHIVHGFQRVVVDGGGGTDVATLYDSAASDRYYGWSDRGVLRGAGYFNDVRGFDRISVFAAAGGIDLARLYDSAGDDELNAWSDRTTMRGNGFYHDVRGFYRVNAFAAAGGRDVARLYDAAGDDRFYGWADRSVMRGGSYYNDVRGFGQVLAYAFGGGTDIARLYDSAGDDVFESSASYATMRGDGYLNYVQGFDRVNAFATAGGNDAAVLHDSSGNDQLRVGADVTSLRGDGFYYYVSGFEQTRALATAGGVDRAVFEDLDGADLLFGRASLLSLGRGGRQIDALGFDLVNAIARDQHDLREDIRAVDYLFESVGDDQ